MTNEQLAKLIQNGDSSLISQLWENVYRLLYQKSAKIYYALKEKFKSCGIEEDDIKQQCYFVFLDALKTYHPPYKFITFLEFPFKKMISKLISQTDNINPKSIDDLFNDEETSLYDILPDLSEDILQKLESKTDSEIIREEVEKLSLKQRTVIKLYYFCNLNDADIGLITNKNTGSVCQLRHRALQSLKKSPVLRSIYY